MVCILPILQPHTHKRLEKHSDMLPREEANVKQLFMCVSSLDEKKEAHFLGCCCCRVVVAGKEHHIYGANLIHKKNA